MPTKKLTQLKWQKMAGVHTELPLQKTPGSAGYDIPLTGDITFTSSQIKEVRLGWCVEIPEGYMGFLRIRSGASTKDSQLIMQSTGIIDSDYRGELVAHITQFRRAIPASYSAGDCIVQLIVIPVPQLESVEVKELSPSRRGAGGFGSTDK